MDRLKPIVVIDRAWPQKVVYFDTIKEAEDAVVNEPRVMQAPHIFTLFAVGAPPSTAYNWTLTTDTASNLRAIAKNGEAKKPFRKGKYTQREVDIIRQSLVDGKSLKVVAAGLHRKYDSVRLKATLEGFRTPTKRRSKT